MWKRNVLVLGATVVVIYVLEFLAKSFDLFSYIHVSRELSIAVLFAFISVGAFLAFGGGFWTRTILATLTPAIAFSLWDLISVISGSPDDGYRGLGTVVGILLAGVSFLGCVFVGGPIFLWRQYQRERHLTPQSRADALKRAADF